MAQSRSIGEILRDADAGRLENILREDREPYDLIGSADRLFDLLTSRDIPFIVVGGIAMLQYVDGRNTRDVDLIVAPDAAELVPEFVVTSEDGDFVRADFDGVQLDLLKTSNPVFELVKTRFARQCRFGDREVSCATPEGLFLLKCYALPSLYRQGEFARADIYEGDLLALLRSFSIDVQTTLALLSPHVLATDVAAIRDIVSEIQEWLAKSAERGARFRSSPG